jgi:hypothetical protein
MQHRVKTKLGRETWQYFIKSALLDGAEKQRTVSIGSNAFDSGLRDAVVLDRHYPVMGLQMTLVYIRVHMTR